MFQDRQSVYSTVESSIIDSVKHRTLAVIPCFNEGKTIGSVVLKAKQYVDEVVVIDDGCTDDTVRVAEHAGTRDEECDRHGNHDEPQAERRSDDPAHHQPPLNARFRTRCCTARLPRPPPRAIRVQALASTRRSPRQRRALPRGAS